MKKLTLFDNSIVDGEIGHDHTNGWAISNDVKSVEFEDGTILENPNFDLEVAKQMHIQPLQNQIVDLQIRLEAATKNELLPTITTITNEINIIKDKISQIEACQ